MCSLSHVDIAVCICKTTLISIGHTGENLDEHSLITMQSSDDGQLFHGDCMLMECQNAIEFGIIATDGAHAR